MEVIEIKDYKELESGENPHQSASIAPVNYGVDYEILSHNKELTYLDFLNLSAAIKILGEFFDVNAAVITKESLLCAAALGSSIDDAFAKVLDCDPISAIEGCAGFSKVVTFETARLVHSMKIKNIIAPDYDKEAFKYLLNTNINIIKINTPLHEIQGFCEKDIKVTPFGILVQDQNLSKLSKDNFVVVTEIKPSQEQVEDAIFAWKISKHLKSKSCIIAKDMATKAIMQGKTNEVCAVESALDYACENSKDAVLAVDSAIENTETINAAIQGRIGLIIESGDSKNSKQILNHVNKYGISMIYTKIRNNKY